MANIEKGPQDPKEYSQEKSPYLELRDIERENATEMQKEIADIQEAKYAAALYELMRRTGNNPELINNLNAFLDALKHQAGFGDSESPIHPAKVKDLSDFMAEKAEELRWDVGGGNRPAHRKPTWKGKGK